MINPVNRKAGPISDYYPLSKITHAIIGCAMKVHSGLGNGFSEVTYQRALAYEMETKGLKFGREVNYSVYYQNKKVGSRRADFVISDKILGVKSNKRT